MKFFKWLYPGIGLKRWVFLCVLGLSIIVVVAFLTVQTIARYSVLRASLTTAFLILGIFLIFTSIKNMIRIFVRALMPVNENDSLVDIVYRKRKGESLLHGPRIVAIGGGTGLSTLLSGVKTVTSNITAIVTVTDNGGSSGRLREEMDVLPPGDIRNCLVSLSDTGQLIRDLFQYRFMEGEGLKGHSFGNLFITALSKVTGDFEKAIAESSKVLAIRGRVLPSTLEKVSLVGEFKDGTQAVGETDITDLRKAIHSISLRPDDCKATQEALEAIDIADIILMGPGSLYTSILPNLLVKDIREAILRSDAYKIFIMNVMTQAGETTGMTAWNHMSTIIEHTDPRIFDACFVNNASVPQAVLKRYEKQNSIPVYLDTDKIQEKGYKIISGETLLSGDQVRHDSETLMKIIMDYYRENIVGEEE